MTIPFLDLLKKLTGRLGGGTAVAEAPSRPASRVVRPKKPDTERLSKTVMPNATRSFSPPDPFRSAATTAAAPRSSMPLELGARKITASSAKARPSQLPPALARALEPKVERTISLRVSDLLDVVPVGFIKPVEILDINAVVSLKASEIEKGMPDRHPMISLPSLYQQVPEIFLRNVRSDDDTRVELPYEKVLEQFQNVHVRADQVRDPAVPHVDTPILTATIEDSERFGTKIEPIETSFGTDVAVKHASAKSFAEAEPDATPAETEAPAKSTPSGQQVISLHSPDLKSKKGTPGPNPTETKIPFELSPNGTGASATERVPASSGPPVPTPLPFTPELAKIAFELPQEKPVTKAPEKKVEPPPFTPDLAKIAFELPQEKPVTKEPEKKAEAPPFIPDLAKIAFKLPPEKPVTKEPEKKVEAPPFIPDLAKIAFEMPPEKSVTRQPEKKAEAPAPVAKIVVEKPATPVAQPSPGKPFTLRLEPYVEKPAAPEPLKSAPPEPSMVAPSVPTSPIAPEPARDASLISVSLKVVLQNLPAFQLAGDIGSVSDDERLTLPLKLIEPQLARGRVSVAPDVFQTALPEKHRGLFHVDVAKTPVAFPLEEVLKNLPVTVLKLRDDQQAIDLDKDFETPFLLKAKEDERRFAPKTEPVEKEPGAKPKVEPAPTVSTEPAVAKPVAEKADPKEIVAQATALAGVKACAITFSDGLSLAGELPEQVEADGLAAMAPSMLERIGQHVKETKLGELIAMTLYAKHSAVSFFARGNVCLTALHENPLAPEIRTRLSELVEKLSKTYAQPESPNVDH